MNITKIIINSQLSVEGGAHRSLSLFNLSCVALGYNVKIRNIAGFTYGPFMARGSKAGWQTLFNISKIVQRISTHLQDNQQWLKRTRTRALKECRRFQRELENYAPLVTSNPDKFIRFVIREYPFYMAGIGVYNYFWRYLEYATGPMAHIPTKWLGQLAKERNDVAKIYPRCEAFLYRAIKIIGKAMGIEPQLLLMMTRRELSRTLVLSRLAITKNALVRRQKGYLYFFSNSAESVQTDSRSIIAMKKYLDLQIKKYTASELHGLSVSGGYVKGTVIKDLKKIRHCPRQPIYVTSMTHPLEIPSLKKVFAIVTDEGGGVLSHAAIVARELNIPCVIGTKIATKVLKNGDRVEVDANKGFVKKL